MVRSKWVVIIGYGCMAICMASVGFITIHKFLEGDTTISCGAWWQGGLRGCTSIVVIGFFITIFFGMAIFVGLKEQKKIRRYNAGERKSKKRIKGK